MQCFLLYCVTFFVQWFLLYCILSYVQGLKYQLPSVPLPFQVEGGQNTVQYCSVQYSNSTVQCSGFCYCITFFVQGLKYQLPSVLTPSSRGRTKYSTVLLSTVQYSTVQCSGFCYCITFFVQGLKYQLPSVPLPLQSRGRTTREASARQWGGSTTQSTPSET